MMMNRLQALISKVRLHQRDLSAAAQIAYAKSGDAERRGPIVRLLPGHRPHGEVERHLHAALMNGPRPLDTLVDEAADRLFCGDLACGGWVADIGVLGPGFYRPYIADMIETLDGLMLVIEPPRTQTRDS